MGWKGTVKVNLRKSSTFKESLTSLKLGLHVAVPIFKRFKTFAGPWKKIGKIEKLTRHQGLRKG